MAEKKTFKRGEVVLTASGKDSKGKSFEIKITPQSFSTVDFVGMKVSGESYYVEKAVKAGATK